MSETEKKDNIGSTEGEMGETEKKDNVGIEPQNASSSSSSKGFEALLNFLGLGLGCVSDADGDDGDDDDEAADCDDGYDDDDEDDGDDDARLCPNVRARRPATRTRPRTR